MDVDPNGEMSEDRDRSGDRDSEPRSERHRRDRDRTRNGGLKELDDTIEEKKPTFRIRND
jgi:hypothetical protein